MLLEREPLRNKAQTAERIKSLVARFASDLDNVSISCNGDTFSTPLSDFSLPAFFNFVRNIPYRKDGAPVEVVSRPYYILKHKDLGMDCKKKSLLLGAYCKLKKIPFRFVGTSNRKDKKIHHIFVQGLIDGEYKNLDATYSSYSMFQPKTVTAMEVL